jgi:hypothetical protein
MFSLKDIKMRLKLNELKRWLIPILAVVIAPVSFGKTVELNEVAQNSKGDSSIVLGLYVSDFNRKIEFKSSKNSSSNSLLSNYYYLVKNNDVDKVVNLYSKKDGSFEEISTQVSQNKDRFKRYSQVKSVNWLESFYWGGYEVASLEYELDNGKKVIWKDGILCETAGDCSISSFLFHPDSKTDVFSSAITAHNMGKSTKVTDSLNLTYNVIPAYGSNFPVQVYVSVVPGASVTDQGRKYFEKLESLVAEISSVDMQSVYKDQAAYKGLRSIYKKYSKNVDFENAFSQFSMAGDSQKSVSVSTYSDISFSESLQKLGKLKLLAEVEVDEDTLLLVRDQSNPQSLLAFWFNSNGLIQFSENTAAWQLLMNPVFAAAFLEMQLDL